MLSTRKKLGWLLIANLCFALIGSASVYAEGHDDLLKLIPEDSWGFVALRSLNTIDEKAKILQDLFGPTIPAPITPLALGMLNLGDTLDMTKPVGVVVLDAQKLGGMDNAFVVLIPAKDPQALVGKLAPDPQGDNTKESTKPAEGKKKEAAKNKEDKVGKDKLENGKKEDGKSLGGSGKVGKKQPVKEEGDDEPDAEEKLPEGLTKVTLAGKPGFMAVKDKIVLFSANADCVAKVLKANKTIAEGFEKTRKTALEKSDIYLSIAAGRVFASYKEMVTPLLAMVMSANDPSGKNAEKLIKMISDMASWDLALALDKNGVSFTLLTTPKKDSDLEKVFKDTKNTSDGYLRFLPKEKYILAMGGTMAYTENTEKVGGGVGFTGILKNAGVQGLNEEALKTIEEGVKTIAKSVTGWALSASSLGEDGEGMIGLALVVETKDSQECVDNIRKIYKKIWDIADNEEVTKLKKCLSHKPDAETIGDVKVDTIGIDMEKLAEVADVSDEEIERIEKVLGKNCTLRFGATGEKYVVVAFGGGKARYQAIQDSVKKANGGLSLDTGIKAMVTKLPSPRAFEGFLAADNLLALIKSIATAIGEEKEFAFEIPAMDAPLAFSSAQIDNVQQMDLFIPMKLITGVKQMIEAQMAAQGQALEDDEEDKDEDEADQDDDEGMKGKDDEGAANDKDDKNEE